MLRQPVLHCATRFLSQQILQGRTTPQHCTLLLLQAPHALRPFRRAGALDRLLGFRQQVGLMAQGFQRALDSSHRVVALKTPHPKLLVRRSPASGVQ